MRVVSASTTLTNTLKWSLLDDYKGFKLYEDKNALPRLYLVHDAIVEPDGFRTVERIRNFDVDPRHTVLLEGGTEVRSDSKGTAEATPEEPSSESVVATRYLPQEVVIEVDAAEPGWVVLTDAWYPGWQATINGRAAEVAVAYHAFRAIRVDPGPQTIVMKFQPDVLGMGEFDIVPGADCDCRGTGGLVGPGLLLLQAQPFTASLTLSSR